MSKTVIVIAGPTAIGKTPVAIEVAKHFQTEIISADSRQCYKELNVGVAKPTAAQLQEVNHYFINSHSIHNNVTAATFEKYALDKVNEIFYKKDIAIMVGGTGFYLKAFCEGFDAIPEVPQEIRNNIISSYEKEGLGWLQNQLRAEDEKYFSKGEIKNPHRIIRALEVKRFTGKSIIDFRSNVKAERNFKIIKILLELPKEQLHQNINFRVDDMMSTGLLQEASCLIAYQHLNALQTVGYKELFDYFKNEVSLPAAVELIKKNTRLYAKRQLTWFRKDKTYTWLNAKDVEKIKEHLNDALDL